MIVFCREDLQIISITTIFKNENMNKRSCCKKYKKEDMCKNCPKASCY